MAASDQQEESSLSKKWTGVKPYDDEEQVQFWSSKLKRLLHSIEGITASNSSADADEAVAVRMGDRTFTRIPRRPKKRAYKPPTRGIWNSLSKSGVPEHTRQILPISACQEAKKWAVMTINNGSPHPSQMIQKLLDDGWCLVQLGDENIPQISVKWNDSRLVHLSMEHLKRLPFKVVPLSPPNSHSRKNIGYLFAIAQGAQIILDIDADTKNLPVKIEDSVKLHQRPLLDKEQLEEKPGETSTWNPYPYFNLINAWPRGFPWNDLKREKWANHSLTRNQTCLPVVQQFVDTTSPDLDAAWKALRKPILGEAQTARLKQIVSPRNVFAPYNSKETVHLRDAFWSLLLPATVDERVSDIWRAYVTQSLLYLMPDACVMYTSSTSRNSAAAAPSHHQTSPSEIAEEIPLYSGAAELIGSIRNLPMKVDNFPAAFQHVYKLLYEIGFLEFEDVEYAAAWMEDLSELGVKMPPIPAAKNTWMAETQVCLNFNNHPNWRAHWPYVANELVTKYLHVFSNIAVLLDDGTFPNSSLSANASAESARINSELLSNFTTDWPADLVSAHFCRGGVGFRQNRCLKTCLDLVAGQNKSTLYMGDDDYINFVKANTSYSKDKIWYPIIAHIPGNPFNETLFNNYTRWSFRGDLYAAMRALKKLPNDMKAGYLKHVKETGQVEGHALSDCAYVPFKYHKRLLEVLDAIEKAEPEFFSEAGMPLALNMVAPGDEKLIFEPDGVLWGRQRTHIPTLSDHVRKDMHLHPLKLSLPGPRMLWREAMADLYKQLS